VLESLGGLVLGLVGTAPAIVVAIPNFSCSTCGQEESLVAAQLLGLAGVSLVGALGVKLAGSLMGGEGRYLGALQGAGIASGASIFVMLALENSPGAFALPMVLFPVLGAVIGYEMSHGAELERQAKGGPAVALFPAVDVSPAGGVVAGLVGSF
jgi:hypothetical protein